MCTPLTRGRPPPGVCPRQTVAGAPGQTGEDLSSLALGQRDLETAQEGVVVGGAVCTPTRGVVPRSAKGLQFPTATWRC